MKLTQKNMLYLAAFALVGYLIYKQWQKSQTKVDESKTVEDVKTEVAPKKAQVIAQINDKTIYTELKKGDTGGMVELLQSALNAWLLPGSKISVDGSFGTKTETAINNLYGKKTASFEFVQNTKPTKKGFAYLG